MQYKNPKIFEIDDILMKTRNNDKINDIYWELRSKVMTDGPIKAEQQLKRIDSRSLDVSSYGLEIFKLPRGLAIVEFYGGSSHAKKTTHHPLYAIEVFRHMTISLFNHDPAVQKRIQSILYKYPRGAKKK